MKVTFSNGKRNAEGIRLVCNETGAEYLISSAPLGGCAIYCNNRKVAERSDLSWALRFVEQDARLGLRTAMSESAFSC